MTSGEPLRPGDRIGFIGLGNMGVPMVQRLLGGGFVVNGYDVNPGQGIALDGHDRYTRTGTLADLVRGTRAVILMLPDSAVVETVLLNDRLLDTLKDEAPESLLIDMSSSHPGETVRMAGESQARGVPFIDAPVSGGVPAARDGSLTIMTGGPDELHALAHPALELIGSHVVHVGGTGAGHAMKAINNFLSASTLVASAEAMVIGQRFGLDPQVMMDVLNGSSGRSWSTLTKWPRYIIPRTFDSGFALSLLLKDIRIATALAGEVGVPAPYARTTESLYQRAVDEMPGDADHTDIHRWVEKLDEQGE